MRRHASVAVAVLVTAGVATGCGSQGIYGIPLPGGADIGTDPMHIKVEFQDVLDLVPQTTVKVDGVSVGRVQSLSVPNQGWTAEVELLVDRTVQLPANAVASVQQTNLLGEKFIELTAPADTPATGTLADGAVIPIDRTSTSTDIEQLLGALSLVINGGGVAQLAPIIQELNVALDGRTDRFKGLLDQANTLISSLNQQRDSITTAFDGLDTLSRNLADQEQQINGILNELPQTMQILDEQRPQFVELLAGLDRLGTVGTDVVEQSKEGLIRDLRALRPTLQALAANGDALVTDLELLPTFPFPDGVEKTVLGNSVNLFISVDLQIGNLLSNLGVGKQEPAYMPPPAGSRQPVIDPSNPYYNGNGPRPGWPTVSLVPILPNINQLVPQPPGQQAAAPAPVTSPLDPLEGVLEQFGLQPGALGLNIPGIGTPTPQDTTGGQP